MSTRKRKPYDQILTGWIIGMIAPMIIFVIFYQVKYSEMNFVAYLQNIWRMKILMKLLSLCVFPNLAFFFVFYRLKYDLAARGVILSTFIYAFAVLVAKVI